MEITGIKDQICDVCHKMWQLGWVAANDGNVSVRLDDGTYLATPTGMSKSFITSDKLLRIDAAGNVLEGSEGLRPSSEIKMHLRCYEKREDGLDDLAADVVEKADNAQQEDVHPRLCIRPLIGLWACGRSYGRIH